MSKKWYIVHVYSGFENKVKASLEEKIASSPNPDKFEEVLVPTEEVVELVKGKRRTSSRKFYPGYLLVKMDLDDETWHIVNNTPKVTGFLGGREKPTPISQEEADTILNRMEAGKNQPQPKFFFETGDEIRVIDGPFTILTEPLKKLTLKREKLRCW